MCAAVLGVAALIAGPDRAEAQEAFVGASGVTAASVDAGRDAPIAGGLVDIHRLSGPITLDGVLDEAAWVEVPPLPLTMYQPVFRGASGRQIQLFVAYDDEALYVGGRFYHDDPSDIRAFSYTRDTWSGDDGFGLFLDTFNDNENAVRFVALPLGARMDMSITGDGQNFNSGGGGPRGMSWNTFWDLETTIAEDGWYGEMRVPFESLRFETGVDGSVVMGMMAYAYEPGKEERWTFPAIPPTSPYTQVSAFQKVRFQDLEARNPVFMTPYALANSATTAELAPGGDTWLAPTERAWEVGGDMKLNPTRNLTLDLTVNTDFAAVEADQQQVNLTRFNLFFDEKRPFFQERAGIFNFATGTERGTLFYSRRIGLSNGEPVPIYGGARMVGRIGGWDLGFIDMQTQEFTSELATTPSENFGVLRLRRRVLNQNSFVGAMTTSRIGTGGVYNVTYGTDALLRLFGDEFLTMKWLQTLQGGDEVRDGAPTGLDAGRFYVDWTRRRQQGLNYQHALVWSGPGYLPEMGFEPRLDFLRLQSDWNYRWIPGQSSVFRLVWLGATSLGYMRNADNVWETVQVSPFLQLETKPGTTFRFSLSSNYEDVLEDFDLSEDANVPAGSYQAVEGQAEFRAPRGWAIRPNVTLTGGQFFDGNRFAISTSFDWPMNRYVSLGGGWEWNSIEFADRGQDFDAHLMRLSTRLAANTRLSLNAFIQYNSLSGGLSTNARFRYQFREGQDLWFVWNEGLNLERDVVGVPRLPFEDARTLTVKYTHTFIF